MNFILIAVIVLGGIALVSAVVLYVCSKKFAVYEDPRLAQVTAILPGANCGGCGYPGCSGMAAALVKGADAGSLEGLYCPVGGTDVMGQVADLLGMAPYSEEEKATKPQVGIVRGLAWTSVGGDTLSVEVNVLPGKGKFELTGQLGDVMKESAVAGISYIRSAGERLHIKPEFFETHDIHIHIPEGAVPKDGPSAGITMATAMISAITGIKVRADVAMTGEITLRGRVLPIGGLKEKILAAKTAKIKKVLVPKKNRQDVEELEAEITNGVRVVYVDKMEDVLKEALVKESLPEAEEKGA